MKSEFKPVGSVAGWAAFRIAQLVGNVILLITVAVVVLVANVPWLAVFGVLFLIVFNAHAHSWSEVRAGDQGIQVRRYLRTHFVPWSQVAEVRYSPFGEFDLNLTLTRPIEGSKRVSTHVLLSLSPSLGEAFGLTFGRKEPEVVSWMKSCISSDAQSRGGAGGPSTFS